MRTFLKFCFSLDSQLGHFRLSLYCLPERHEVDGDITGFILRLRQTSYPPTPSVSKRQLLGWGFFSHWFFWHRIFFAVEICRSQPPQTLCFFWPCSSTEHKGIYCSKNLNLLCTPNRPHGKLEIPRNRLSLLWTVALARHPDSPLPEVITSVWSQRPGKSLAAR